VTIYSNKPNVCPPKPVPLRSSLGLGMFGEHLAIKDLQRQINNIRQTIKNDIAGIIDELIGDDYRNVIESISLNGTNIPPVAKNVDIGAIPTSEKGVANGVASLGGDGKVPSSQLPTYVDSIVEGYLYNGSFYEDSAHTILITPSSGTIYVDLTDDSTYRWTGTSYISISNPVDYATQAEAEAGQNNTKVMTPLRTKQAFDAQSPAAITIDSALSNSSTNPVQNKVVKAAVDSKANLDSPTFTGTPTAPTPTSGDDSTKIATTAFVQEELSHITPSTADVYGFDMDLSNSDPDGCVTYVGLNMSYTPAQMDYVNDVFDYGSWENAFFMPKPCMLSFGGTVEHYLKEDDYTKFADGTASDVATSTTANAMMEWPVIYVLRWQTGSIYHFRCSNRAFMDTSYPVVAKCLANINDTGDIVPFYTPIYLGSVDGSNRLRSLSGTTDCANETMVNLRTKAANNGSGWEIDRMVDWLLINDLLVLMSKSRNGQAKYGDGWTYGIVSTSYLSSGTLNDKGLFYGKNDTSKTAVKVFGMENWWGNRERFLVGWIFSATSSNHNGVQKVKLTYGNQDGSSGTGYNLTGSGYIDVPNSSPTGYSGGLVKWVVGSVATEYGLIPKDTSSDGSATTYACDGFSYGNSQDPTTHVAQVGGDCSDTKEAGPSYASLKLDTTYAATWSSDSVGAALSYK